MKRLIFEVEEGETRCENCPFSIFADSIELICAKPEEFFDCYQQNLQTLKFIGDNEKDNKI